MKINLLLLYGGPSEEHDVSLRTGAAVLKNLDREKYHLIPVGILKDKGWYLQDLPGEREEPDILEIKDLSRPLSLRPGKGLILGEELLPVDCAFLLIHGTFGEDGRIQGLLEWMNIPYTGSKVLGSAVGMDKSLIKEIWQNKGIPVVPWIEENLFDGNFDLSAIHKRIERTLEYPVFIKPANSGSSVGASFVTEQHDLEGALYQAFSIDSKILIEKYIPCREIECAVLGSREARAFPLGEIAPKGHVFYDYDAKYLDPDGAQIMIPAPLDKEVAQKIQEYALLAYKSVGLKGYSRVDFFVHKETQEIYLNEVNTLPGFTNISMFPMMGQQGGLSYSELLDQIIELALEEKSQDLKTVDSR